jgi:hypothetical protein
VFLFIGIGIERYRERARVRILGGDGSFLLGVSPCPLCCYTRIMMHRKLESEIVTFASFVSLDVRRLYAFRIECICWLGKESFVQIDFPEKRDLMKFYFHKGILSMLCYADM